MKGAFVALAFLIGMVASAFGQVAPTMQPCIANSSGYGCTPTSTKSPFPITPNSSISTYSVADVNIANIGAGDVFCVAGSATKTVYIQKIHASALAGAAIVVNLSIIKRSSLGTGGTSAAETVVPNDSNNAAGTATATSYTVSPTPGTTVGAIMAHKLAAGVQGNTAAVTEAYFRYGNDGQQPIILHGTAENVCVNVGALGTGGSWAIYAEWIEQ